MAEEIFNSAVESETSAILLKVRPSRPREIELVYNIKGFDTVNFTLVYQEYLPRNNGTHVQTFSLSFDSVPVKIDGEFVVKLADNAKGGCPIDRNRRFIQFL